MVVPVEVLVPDRSGSSRSRRSRSELFISRVEVAVVVDVVVLFSFVVVGVDGNMVVVVSPPWRCRNRSRGSRRGRSRGRCPCRWSSCRRGTGSRGISTTSRSRRLENTGTKATSMTNRTRARTGAHERKGVLRDFRQTPSGHHARRSRRKQTAATTHNGGEGRPSIGRGGRWQELETGTRGGGHCAGEGVLDNDPRGSLASWNQRRRATHVTQRKMASSKAEPGR